MSAHPSGSVVVVVPPVPVMPPVPVIAPPTPVAAPPAPVGAQADPPAPEPPAPAPVSGSTPAPASTSGVTGSIGPGPPASRVRPQPASSASATTTLPRDIAPPPKLFGRTISKTGADGPGLAAQAFVTGPYEQRLTAALAVTRARSARGQAMHLPLQGVGQALGQRARNPAQLAAGLGVVAHVGGAGALAQVLGAVAVGDGDHALEHAHDAGHRLQHPRRGFHAGAAHTGHLLDLGQ